MKELLRNRAFPQKLKFLSNRVRVSALRASQVFFDTASKLGMNRVFGNPGTTELALLDELGRRNDMEYVLTLTDGLAVGCAEGESLFESKPALVNLHTVPGLGNSIAFLYSALRNRTPLVVTAGNQDTRHAFHEPVLQGNLTEIARPVVKASFEARNALDVQRLLIRAWKLSQTPPCGPVFVSLPMNLVEEENNQFSTLSDDFQYDHTLGISENAIQKIAKGIDTASSPAIIAGFEVAQLGIENELQRFVEQTGVPVFSEPRPVRAPFDSRHPLFAGILPSSASEINSTLAPFDFILVIGWNLQMLLYSGKEPLLEKSVIEITSDPEEASRRTWETHVCDLKGAMVELSSKSRRIASGPQRFGRDISTWMGKEADSGLSVGNALGCLSNYVKERVIFDELSSSLSPILTSKLGFLPGKYFHLREQLGWGLAAGVGYAVAGGNPVVITGDGSFNYSVQVLWTASHYRCNVKIVVLDNSGYGVLKNGSKSKYPSIASSSWLSPVTNAELLAKAYEVEARSIADQRDLEENLDWLFDGDLAKLLRIRVPSC